MSDWVWRVLWIVILGAGLLGMAGLLLSVGFGSVRELRQSLDELRAGSGCDEPVDEPADEPVDEPVDGTN